MLAASPESFLIFLLIAGASAFFNWLKKRGQKTDDWSQVETPAAPSRRERPGPPISQPASRTTNWEEELRRMLEGTVVAPTRTPPPVVVPERKPAPTVFHRQEPDEPPQTMAVPKVFTETKYYKAHCNYCDGHIEFPASAMDEVTTCPHCHRSTVLRPFENTPVEVLAHQAALTEFNSSTRKYEEASQLSQRVAAHMHDVGHKAVGLTSIETKKKLWPEVAQTVALFRNAKSVRQAVVASLILGPPKALEN